MRSRIRGSYDPWVSRVVPSVFFWGSFSLFPSFLCRILSGCHRSLLLGEFIGFIPRAGFKSDGIETIIVCCDLSFILLRLLLERPYVANTFTSPLLFPCLIMMVLLITVGLPVLSRMNHPNRSLTCVHRLPVDISLYADTMPSNSARTYSLPSAPLSNGLWLSWTTPNVSVIRPASWSSP